MSHPIKPLSFDALVSRGKFIVTVNEIAERYMMHVVRNLKTIDPDFSHSLEDCARMKLGMVAFLKAVDDHYTLDTAKLDGYTDDELCIKLNEALEHSASTGMFKEKWRPDFIGVGAP